MPTAPAEMRVQVVGTDGWHPFLDEALAREPDAPAGATRAILRLAHDRHVGITAELAAGLAAVLASGKRRRAAAIGAAAATGASEPRRLWLAVFDRLLRPHRPAMAGHPGRLGDGEAAMRARSTGLLLGLAPFHTVARIAVPLVRAVLDRLDTTYLYGGPGHAVPRGFTIAYAEHCAAMRLALAGALDDPDTVPPLFWDEAALVLDGLIRVSGSARRPAPAPQTDAATVALMVRLDPALAPAGRVPPLAPPRRIATGGERSGDRPRLGGVTGVRQTRRPEDVDDMLVSEQLNDRVLLLDRVMHQGFLVHDRPPPIDRRRALLILGVMPHGLRGDAGRLAKAAWFDCLRRFAGRTTLARHLVDLAWIEGDGVGGARRFTSSLEAAQPAEGRRTTMDRRSFAAALGWAPDFVDTGAGAAIRPNGGRQLAGDAAPIDWLAAAIAAAGTAMGAAQGCGDGDLFSRYRDVRCLVFLPAPAGPAGEPDGARLSRRIAHRLGLPAMDRRVLGLVWVPAAIVPADGWALSDARRPFEPLAVAAEDTPPLRAVSGKLVGAWLDRLADAGLR